jgi:hypothetical protein
LNGKIPAQAARMDAPGDWKTLIEQATKHKAKLPNSVISQKNQAKEPVIKVIAK